LIISENYLVSCSAFKKHHAIERTLLLQEETKMIKGTVKWFDQSKGFGFITPEDGSKDVFVHISAVDRAGLATLQEGQEINVEVEMGQKGPQVKEIVTD